MSDIDERIRGEMHRPDRPVDGSPAFGAVSKRKARRRTALLVQRVALVVFVVAGTITGGYALTRMVGLGDPAPGEPDVSVPPPSETAGPAGIQCDRSTILADLDGDLTADEVSVYAPAAEGADCEDPATVGAYQAQVVFGREGEPFAAEPQALPECETPFGCQVLAAPDLDGDGADEIVIQTVFGASTQYVALYRLDPEWNTGDPALERLEVASPGDPWHEEFGFPPGPALFARYGSVTHVHDLDCNEDGDTPLIAATTAVYLSGQGDDTLYDVHLTWFDASALPVLTVDSSDDVGPGGPEVLEMVQSGDTICGAPVIDQETPPAEETTDPPVEETTGGDVWTYGYLCEVSSIEADLDGDGSLDGVDVFAKVDPSAPDCESAPDLGELWGIRAQLSEAEIQAQPLPECAGFMFCEVVGATDIDGDGISEILIRFDAGAGTDLTTLYGLDGSVFRRMQVAAPGDSFDGFPGPWLPPGPVSLSAGGGSVYPSGWGCVDGMIVVGGRALSTPDYAEYHIHRTFLRLQGFDLVVVDTSDQTGAVNPGDAPPPTDVGEPYCGAGGFGT